MLCQHCGQAAHGSIVGIVDLQRCAQLILLKRKARCPLQVGNDPGIACLGKFKAKGVLTVLRIGHGHKGNGRNRVFPVFSQNLQAVTQAGNHNGGGAIVHALHPQLHNGLHDGADKGWEIPLGFLQLHISAPGAHGNSAHGMDNLFRCIDRSRQNYFLSGRQIRRFLSGRICRNLMEAIQQFLYGHIISPPCSFP